MPRLLANKPLPLLRFWIPYGPQTGDSKPRTLALTDGILPDPDETFGKTVNPDLKTLPDIEPKRCFALLGQPGLGKSMAVEQWVESLRSRASAVDCVTLLRGRALASPDEIWRVTVDSPRWKRARQEGGEVTLVLDGLDEALQRLPVILSTLRRCLDSEPVERTRVVLVSRVADWRDSRAEELFSLWPEVQRGGAFELCPLRWKDVHLAARESGLREDAFAHAAIERRVAWMAARPKLLLMLIEEYRAHRRLPNSRRKLFARAALRMCDEHEPERHEVLQRSDRPVIPSARVYPVVARVAALLLLSGRSYVLLDGDTERTPADLPLAEILGGSEPLEDTAFEIDRAHVFGALDSSHFVACGPGRLGFDHQAMAEFMAAEYLRRCTTPQLRGLLTQRVDAVDYLLPQFREVSAWIAVQHRDFCSYLLSREPRFLLDADAVELDEATRRRAVAALLDQMDREEAFDGSASETFLKSLHHSQLTRQLRPYIVDPTRNVVVRRTAIRLAGAARCRTLKDDLWRLLDQPQQVSVRHSAIQALGAMATAVDNPMFQRVLRGDFGMDVNEELRGEALEFLVPRYLPVRAVLKFLVPRDDNFLGTYWGVLAHHLPNNVRIDDVLPILRECNRRGKAGRHPGPLKELADAAVKLALQHFDNPQIRQGCIRFLATQAEQHSWRGTWNGVRPANLSAKAEAQLRRTIMEGFVKLAKGKFSDFVRFDLWPTPDDLGWFLENLRRARGALRGIWADLIARLTFQPILPKFQQDFISTYQSVAILRKKLPRPRRFDLMDTLDRRRRATERWREVWERRSQRRRTKEAKGKLTVAKCLEHFREGRWEWWPGFIAVLHRFETDEEQSRGGATTREYDISTWHGWSQLSRADRRMARQIAGKFLREAPVPPRKLGTLYTYDQAAVRALILLGKSVTADGSLRDMVRKKWVLAILHGLYNEEPELERASVVAFRLNPRVCLAWAHEELVYRDSKDSEHTSLRRFRRCWDDALTAVVSAFARKTRRPRTLLRIFTLLREVAPNAALELWRKSSPRRGGFGKRERMITFLGLMAFPGDCWEASFARLQRTSRATQIRFIAEHVGWLDYDFRGWSSTLTEGPLADLYLLLADLFPPKSLSDYSRGGSLRSRDHIGDMQRACINVLVQRGSAKACAELRRISESVPLDDRLWIRWRLREAIDQRLRTEWTHDQPAPAAILRLARTANAVRVRDAGELQDAIVASFARLQAAMHVGAYPKVRAFWRDPGRVPQEEREVSRAFAEWLETDLRGDSGIVTDREPQIGWRGQVDLKVEIPPNTNTRRSRLVVIIEVKECLHPKVATACASQLAEGYLRRKKLAHGIYVVAWFDVSASKVRWHSIDAAQAQLKAWAAAASTPPLDIRGVAFDCRWIGMEAPSSI